MSRRGIGSGDDHRSIGLGASAMAAVLWGFGSIFVALTFAPGLVLTFYRLWLGAALFCVVVYATGRRLSRSLFQSTWLGGILLAGDMALFYSAVKLTSIIDVTVIGAFQPALVMLAAPRFFGECLGRRDVGWILLAMVGVTVAVIGPGTTSHHEVVGDLLAVGSLVSFSAYWLVSKRARQEHGALEIHHGCHHDGRAHRDTRRSLVRSLARSSGGRRLVLDIPTGGCARRWTLGNELGAPIR